MSTSTQFSMVSERKYRHAEDDRISNLPDRVITHILSRLPTKDAVRTSVLSKYWEYKWTSIPNIELVDDIRLFNYNESSKDIFANFVYRTLLLSQNLQTLRLSCYREDSLSRVKAWISFALSREVHCLNITYSYKGIVLPCDLFHCYSLRKLVLHIPCAFKVVAGISFIYLTIVYLREVEILNELPNADVVKFKFPVLTTLSLIQCKWWNAKIVDIDAPRMTTFESQTPYCANVNDYSIKINGSSLTTFKCCGTLSENIVISGEPKVVYAALKNSDTSSLENSGLVFRKLLQGYSSLEDLKLSGAVLEAIAQSKLGVPLPKFCKMKKLVLSHLGNTGGALLLELLVAMPFVKFLVIDLMGWKDHDYDAEGYIPSCIVSHLEEITFTYFLGELPELELIKFFLKNALHLERLHVHVNPYPCYEDDDCDAFADDISAFPTASNSVMITVS